MLVKDPQLSLITGNETTRISKGSDRGRKRFTLERSETTPKKECFFVCVCMFAYAHLWIELHTRKQYVVKQKHLKQTNLESQG